MASRLNCAVRCAGFVSLVLLLGFSPRAWAQREGGLGGGGGASSIGGVSIDANGILKKAKADDVFILRTLRERGLRQIPGELAKPCELRKVSLRRLEEAIVALQAAGQVPTVEMRCLAGLQRIRYVFVYPEQNDIVLAGFAEGWKIDAQGNVVGLTTVRPTLLLDDLVVALRAAKASGGLLIECSIDPTAEGMKRLQEYARTLTENSDPSRTAQEIEQQLGPQVITVQGVPQTSNFARVLVAADYHMNRLGMNLDPPPVSGLPSYLHMMKPGGRGLQTMTPRWWMVPDYDPLVTDDDGLAWELRGGRVKTLTDETLFAAGGARSQTGKTNPMALQWAKNFTAKYDELSLKDSVFGQLRNCMDLAIVAALVVKENLANKAGYQLVMWFDETQLAVEAFHTARQTDSVVSFMRKGTNWIVSASGGVQAEIGSLIANPQKSEKLPPARNEAAPPKGDVIWWWN